MSFSENSPFNQKEIRECALTQRYDLLALGPKIKPMKLNLTRRPPGVLTTGTILIVMGTDEEITRTRDSF